MPTQQDPKDLLRDQLGLTQDEEVLSALATRPDAPEVMQLGAAMTIAKFRGIESPDGSAFNGGKPLEASDYLARMQTLVREGAGAIATPEYQEYFALPEGEAREEFAAKQMSWWDAKVAEPVSEFASTTASFLEGDELANAPDDVREASERLRAQAAVGLRNYETAAPPPEYYGDEQDRKTIKAFRDAARRRRIRSEYEAKLISENAFAQFEGVRKELSPAAEEIVTAAFRSQTLPKPMIDDFKALPFEQQRLVSALIHSARRPSERNAAAEAARGFIHMLVDVPYKTIQHFGVDSIRRALTDEEEYNRFAQTRALLAEAEAPRLKEYGFFGNTLIGMASTIPYMGWTMVPGGTAMVAAHAASEFERQVAADGGDVGSPDFMAMKWFTAAAYAAVERLPGMRLKKTMTDLERRAMVLNITRRLNVLYAAGRWATETFSETKEETIQKAMESALVAYATDRDVIRTAVRDSINEAKDVVGTMGGVALFGLGGAHLAARTTSHLTLQEMMAGRLHAVALIDAHERGDQADIAKHREALAPIAKLWMRAGGNRERALQEFMRRGYDQKTAEAMDSIMARELRTVMADQTVTKAQRESFFGKGYEAAEVLAQVMPDVQITANEDGSWTAQRKIGNTVSLTRIEYSNTLGFDPNSPAAASSIVAEINRVAPEAGLTLEEWNGMSPTERMSVVGQYGLYSAGDFRFTTDKGARFDEGHARTLSGTIALNPVARPSNVIHEALHAFVRYLRETGAISEADIAKAREEFGDPRPGNDEAFNEETAARAYDDYVAGRSRLAAGTLMDRIVEAADRMITAAVRFRRQQREAATARTQMFDQITAGTWTGITAAVAPKSKPAPDAKPETAKVKPQDAPEPPEQPVPATDAAPTPEAPAKAPPAPAAKPAPAAAPGGMNLDSVKRKDEAEEARKLKDTEVPEGQWRATTPQGNITIQGDWIIVDLDDLITSDNPRFNQALQPRDRRTVSSRAQIQRIANALDPTQLFDSPITDTGSPIVAPDMSVLSGNGRTLALRLAHEKGKLDSYARYVRARAARLGIVIPDGITTPVMVRRISDQYSESELRRITELSNRPSILVRTPAEQADSDAKSILQGGILSLYAPSQDGSLMAASNRDFVTAFVRATGDDSLVDSDGHPTDEAERRIRRAMLAIVIGTDADARTLIRSMVERASELGMKREVDGITRGAGAIAEQADFKPEFSLLSEIAQALRGYVQWRNDGGANIDNWLAQADMFNERSQEAAALIKAFAQRRTAGGVSAILLNYAQRARTALTEPDMFGTPPPTKLDLINQSVAATETEAQDAALNEGPEDATPAAASAQPQGAPAAATAPKPAPAPKASNADAIAQLAERLTSGEQAPQIQGEVHGAGDLNVVGVQYHPDAYFGETPELPKGAPSQWLTQAGTPSFNAPKALLAYLILGNKGDIIAQHGLPLAAVASLSPGGMWDCFGGAGMYTVGMYDILKSLPPGSRLNEFEFSRGVTLQRIKRDAPGVLTAFDAIFKRFMNRFGVERPQTKEEQNEAADAVRQWFADELNGRHEGAPQYIIDTQNDSDGRIPLHNTNETAAFYLLVQNLMFGSRPLTVAFPKAGGVEPEWVTGDGARISEAEMRPLFGTMGRPMNIKGAIAGGTGKNIHARVAYLAQALKDVDVSIGDGWALAASAPKGSFIPLDTSYFPVFASEPLGVDSAKSKSVIKYGKVTGEDADPAVWTAKMRQLVARLSDNGVHVDDVNFFITNNWDDRVVEALEGMGFVVARAVRKKEGEEVSELIAMSGLFKSIVPSVKRTSKPSASFSYYTEHQMSLYRRTYGEIEARNASKRRRMTQEERAATPLSETEDTPREDALVVRYSIAARVTPEQDRAYLAAVEQGDMKTAQRMVDWAAKVAGYTIEAWHNSGNRFTKFDLKRARQASDIQAFFFKDRKDPDKEYGKQEYHVYIRLKNPANYKQLVSGFDAAVTYDAGVKQRERLIAQGFDGGIVSKEDGGMEYAEIVAFSPSQIKSADPVTYDDAGRVIPLSERFNPATPDIRYSVETDTLGLYSQLRAVLDAKMPARQSVRDLRNLTDPQKGTGIKADELQWSGFAAWLDSLPEDAMVTKEQALEAARDFRLEETVLGVDEMLPEGWTIRAVQNGPQRYGKTSYLVLLDPDGNEEDISVLNDRQRLVQRARRASNQAQTKYDQYTLPGSDPGTYAERLLTVPDPRDQYLAGIKAELDSVRAELASIRAESDKMLSTWTRAQSDALKPKHDAMMRRETELLELENSLEAIVYQPKPRGETFQSSHWTGHPNVLLHIRHADRTTADGKALLVEEIQSDWHQKARGLRDDEVQRVAQEIAGNNPPNDADIAEANKRVPKYFGYKREPAQLQALRDRADQLATESEALANKGRAAIIDSGKLPFGWEIREAPQTARRLGNLWAVYDDKGMVSSQAPTKEKAFELSQRSLLGDAAILPEDKARYDEIGSEYVSITDILNANSNQTLPPAAPFSDTSKGWARLAMKRVFRLAAERGITRILWTTGATQTDRYDEAMRQNVDRIIVQYRSASTVRVVALKDGERVFTDDVPLYGTTQIQGQTAGLEDVIGKSLAQQVRAAPYQKHEFSGGDLSIGGHGMREFYDIILPRIANDLGKKYGARTTDATIPHDGSMGDTSTATTPDQAEAALRRSEKLEAEGVRVHAFDIPEAMRADILKGQARFSIAAESDIRIEEVQALQDELLRSPVNDDQGDARTLDILLEHWIANDGVATHFLNSANAAIAAVISRMQDTGAFINRKDLVRRTILDRGLWDGRPDAPWPVPVYVSAAATDKMTIGLLMHKDGLLEEFEGNDEATPETLDLVDSLTGAADKVVTVYTSQPADIAMRIASGDVPEGIFVSPSRAYAAGYFGEGREVVRMKLPMSRLARHSEVDWQVRPAPAPRNSFEATKPDVSGASSAVAVLTVMRLEGREPTNEDAARYIRIFRAQGATPDELVNESREFAESTVGAAARKALESADPSDAAAVVAKHAEMQAIYAAREGAKRGARMGRLAQKAEDEAAKSAIRDAVGTDLQQLVVDTGVDPTLTMLAVLPESFAPGKPKAQDEDGADAEKPDSEGQGQDGAEGTAGPEATPEQLADRDARCRNLLDMTKAWYAQREARRQKRAEERAAAKAQREADQEGLPEGKEADDIEDAGGEDAYEADDAELGVIPRELLEGARVDLNNAQEFAHFLRLWMGDWLVEHSNGELTPATVWTDPEAIARYRKTMQAQLSRMADGMLNPGDNAPKLVATMIGELPETGNPNDIERRTAAVLAVIQRNAIRQSRKKLIKDIRKGITEQAAKKKKFNPMEEDIRRKVGAEPEQIARYIKQCIGWTRKRIEKEREALDATVSDRATLYDAQTQEPALDVTTDAAHHYAVLKLAVLNRWAGLRELLPGEILAAGNEIMQWIETEQERLQKRWFEIEEANATQAGALVEAIVAGKPERGRPKLEWTDRLCDSLIATVHQRMRDLIKFADEGPVRDGGLKAADEIRFLLAQGSERYTLLLKGYRDAWTDAVEQVAGKHRSADYMKHLHDDIPAEIAAQVSRQGYHEHFSYGQAMQLYASLTQQFYDRNVVKHERQDHARLLESVLTPEDMRILNRLRQIYEERREELSAAVERITGVPVWRPDILYMPVRMKTRTRGGIRSHGAMAWSALSATLTPRQHNDLDFDEAATIQGIYAERAKDTAAAIAYGENGIRIRGIIGRPAVKDAIERYAGKAKAGALYRQVEEALIGERIPSNSPIDKSMDLLLKLNVYTALSGNVVSTAKQMLSTPVWAMTMDGGWKDVQSAIAEVISRPELVREFIDSDGFRARYQGGMIREFHEILINPGRNWLERAYRTGMLGIQFGDAVPSVLVGAGLFHAKRNAYSDNGMDPETARQRALTMTWALVEESQQSGRTENMPEIYRSGNVFARAVLQFGSAQLLQLSHELQALREWHARPTPKTRQALLRAVVINHVIMPFFMGLVTKVWNAILGDEPPDEDEMPDEIKAALWEMTLGPIGRVAVIGAWAQAGYDAMVRRKVAHWSRLLPAENVFRLTGTLGVAAHDIATMRTEDLHEDMLRAIRDTSAPGRHAVKAYRNYIQDQ